MANAVLLKGEDYEATTARDETPGQIPSTMREVFELIYVVQGGAEYWVEDQFYRLRSGDILLIPAGVMVGAALKLKGCPFLRHSIWMSRRYFTFLELQDETSGYSFLRAQKQKSFLLRSSEDAYEELETYFENVVLEGQGENLSAELSTKAKLSSLIVQLNRLLYQSDDALQAGAHHRLSPVLSYIHENCTAALTVEALAQQFNYSSSHLAHSFKNQMGTSLYHYIVKRRLQIGREAMMNGVPVKEAFQQCGFGDYAGFYRAFTKEYGLSPQQYKKKNL